MTICEGSASSRVGVWLMVAVIILFAAYFFSSLLDGYWKSGTYGFLVIPGLAFSIFFLKRVVLVAIHHTFYGYPLVFQRDESVNYMKPGHETIPCSDIDRVEISKRAFGRRLFYFDRLGNEIGCHSLVFAKEDDATILKRLEEVLSTNCIGNEIRL